ncbi:hypothetical protein ElyMa_001658200 [Elysia marginata]|uniref:Uncharacterized protein n=1 Tax=Elysia marginata TaxID=1093978 RepID=A0AAV4JPK4_9GAST|nr:hypothetical protein ElyMa_001658200 [Elysia marginata]
MASRVTRMTSGVLSYKQKCIGELEQEFHRKLTDFVARVNTKMESSPEQVAARCFDRALLFLTQEFPETEDLGSDFEEPESKTQKLEEENARLEDCQKNILTLLQEHEGHLKDLQRKTEDDNNHLKTNLRELATKQEQNKDQLKSQVTQLVTKQENYDQQFKDHVRQIATKQEKYDQQLEDHEERLTHVQSLNNDITKLQKTTMANTKNILGLRKLQRIFKIKNGTSTSATATKAAAATATTAAIATATATTAAIATATEAAAATTAAAKTAAIATATTGAAIAATAKLPGLPRSLR